VAAAIGGGRWLDKRWPQAVECTALAGFSYNVDLVANAGLRPEKPPTTWDEVYDRHTNHQVRPGRNGGSSDPIPWTPYRGWRRTALDAGLRPRVVAPRRPRSFDDPKFVSVLNTIKPSATRWVWRRWRGYRWLRHLDAKPTSSFRRCTGHDSSAAPGSRRAGPLGAGQKFAYS
jgi:hypothetical protein